MTFVGNKIKVQMWLEDRLTERSSVMKYELLQNNGIM